MFLPQVKVTALTRLVVSLYAFSALALMLHMQLHILGKRNENDDLQTRSWEEGTRGEWWVVNG